ncbi:MAG: branched-chain amino acid aminotransferase [Oscillospiraceae bacterium]|jgi:branched-chain amino acid aminotransferase|nr:branched-chain amino acid aminotransferase [Oscillospiraceae bacterium]
MQEIKITFAEHKKVKPGIDEKLGFGKFYTDHMFIMDYDINENWHNPRIVPYGSLSLDPATICLHYGQQVYEGMKAYMTKNNKILLFRPKKHIERLNISNERLCIPKLDEKFCVDAIKKLVNIDKDWTPTKPGTALYIRPFILATDPYIGVRPGEKFRFIVICSPVSSYYSAGLGALKIYVEEDYVRAVKGGVGFAKTAGNYAASLKAQNKAASMGYDQVIWLDAIEKRYVEEVGTMNVFFVIDNEIITPELQDSILSGITRLSCISLLRSWGEKISERRISINEIHEAYLNGRLKEAFGTGTAAVVSPIGLLRWRENIMKINGEKPGPIAKKLYDVLTGIQFGQIEDTFSWTLEIDACC